MKKSGYLLAFSVMNSFHESQAFITGTGSHYFAVTSKSAMTASLHPTSTSLHTLSTSDIEQDLLKQARDEIEFFNMPMSSQKKQKKMMDPKLTELAEVSIGRIAMIGWVGMTSIEAITGKSLPDQVVGLFLGGI